MPETIATTLTPSEAVFMPGSPPVELTLTVRNAGYVVDQYTIQVEGLDPTWYTLPSPLVSLFPGDTVSVPILLQAPRGQTLTAGRYPFSIRVASRDNPSSVAYAQASVEMQVITGWTMEMQPQRVTGRRGNFRITMANTGNSDIDISLAAKDPEQGLRYSFSDRNPRISPFESRTVTLSVRRPGIKITGMPVPYMFNVTGQAGAGHPPGPMVAPPDVKAVDGQLFYTPLLRSWRGPIILLALAVLAIAFLVWRPDQHKCDIPFLGGVFCPKPGPPQITLFVSDRSRVQPGESADLRWEAKGAVKAEIAEDKQAAPLGADGTGSLSVTPDTDRSYTLCVSNDAGDKTCNSIFITVQQAVAAGGATEPTPVSATSGGGTSGGTSGGGSGGTSGGTSGGGTSGGGGTSAGGGTKPVAAANKIKVTPPKAAPKPTTPPQPAQGTQPSQPPTATQAPAAPAAAQCDTSGNTDGKAEPSSGRAGDTIQLSASGFQKDEPIFFVLVTPQGDVRAADEPISGAVRDDGTLDIEPIVVNEDFTQVPGQWSVTFQGATSSHRSTIFFCIAP